MARSSRDPWDSIVRPNWMELRLKLNPSELRHPLVKAKLITEAESMDLDPVIGLGRPRLNDRLHDFLMGSGRSGFTSFVSVLRQFGSQYRDVLLILGQEPGPDIVVAGAARPDAAGPGTGGQNARQNYEVTTVAERPSEPDLPKSSTPHFIQRSHLYDAQEVAASASVGNSAKPVADQPVQREPNIWDVIIKNHNEELHEYLQPYDLAGDCLREGLISNYVYEIMKNETMPRQDRTHKFLMFLKGTGEKGVSTFYDILKSRELQCEVVREVFKKYVKMS